MSNKHNITSLPRNRPCLIKHGNVNNLLRAITSEWEDFGCFEMDLYILNRNLTRLGFHPTFLTTSKPKETK